jgi:hypothetical protein
MPGLHSGLTSDDPRVLRAVMPDRIQNVVVRGCFSFHFVDFDLVWLVNQSTSVQTHPSSPPSNPSSNPVQPHRQSNRQPSRQPNRQIPRCFAQEATVNLQRFRNLLRLPADLKG